MDDKKEPKTFKAQVKKQNMAKELGKYAVENVIIPQTRDALNKFFKSTINMMSDAATKSLDHVMYPGGNAPKGNTSRSGVATYTPSVNYSTRVYKSDSRPQRENVGIRSSVDLNDISFDTQEEASELLGLLKEEIENYGKAKVATLIERLRDEKGNRIPTVFTDYNYGWVDANAFDYHSYGGRYYLDLPRPINIENV